MNKRITALWKFLTYDIWRITEDEVTKTTFSLYNIIKTIYLCINRFAKDRLVNNASALTYSTLRNDGALVFRFPLHGFYFRFQERFCKLSVVVIHLLFSLPSKRVLFIIFILSISL